MDGFLQKMARCLAVLAATVTAGSASAAELGAIPEDMIRTLAEQEQIDQWEPGDRRSLMHLLAADPRAGVRMSLVKQVAPCSLPLDGSDEDWLMTLASDPSPDVREAFASTLGALLERASSLERTYIVTAWAGSPREPVRLAIARALGSSFEAVGTRTALAYLSQDPSAEVRSAARQAAERRHLTLKVAGHASARLSGAT